MQKRVREYKTNVFGFKLKLLNAPLREFEGEWILDLDFNRLEEDIFFDMLKSPKRLTGDHVKFLRRHLGLKQKDMKDILGMDQGNFSKTEGKGSGLAFETDAQLIALRVEFAKIKLSQMKDDLKTLSDFVHKSGDLEDPEKTIVRKCA